MQLRNGRIIVNKLIIKDDIKNNTDYDTNYKIIKDDNNDYDIIKTDIINDYDYDIDKENVDPLSNCKSKFKNKCKKSNIKKCGFCRKSGHTINNCNDNEIYELDEYLSNIALLDFLQEKKKYTAHIIQNLPDSSLKVICYLHNVLFNNSNGNIANTLVEKYINDHFQNLLTKMNDLNDENICDFLEIVYSKILESRIEVEDEIITKKYFFQKINFILLKENISIRYFIKIERVSNNLLDTKSTIQNLDNSNSNNNIECPICYSELNNSTRLITQCGHNYCYTCFYNYLNSLKNDKYILPCCCFCRKEIAKFYYCNQIECNKIQDKFLLPNLFILDNKIRDAFPIHRIGADNRIF